MYNEESNNAKELSFPHIELDTYSGKPCNQHFGLTKRELFAAMAMQGIMADPNVESPIPAASLAVQCADALLAELNKGKEATMSKDKEYCKCCRCKNVHPYSERILKDGEFTKEYGMRDIVCPRCGALNYFSVDKNGNKIQ